MRVRTIKKGLELYERAKKVIPGGAQTLSKQYGRTIQGVAPPLISDGAGCKVYDYDGNEYIDWTASLGPIILGYDYFSQRAYDKVLLPMTNHLEVELAEKLISIIPSAEMVRFFKNGSDATSAAVRLSKYIKVEGRDRSSIYGEIICSGYHGWHDWYASTLDEPRDGGITFSHGVIKLSYGDLVQLDYFFNKYNPSCFILEPMNRQCPEKASKEYLQGVRQLCDDYGVILIFDEMIMGFRYAMAGGEEYFGITPDLSCYGKAIANGFPLAVLTGKKELMKEIEPLQVSGTNFGELLSIKAALQTIEIMEKENVIIHLWKIGSKLEQGIKYLIGDNSLEKKVYLKGWGPWSSLVWSCKKSEHYFLQELAKRGILYQRDFFSMYSHLIEDVDKTLEIIKEIFEKVKMYSDSANLEGGGINNNLFLR